MTEAPRAASATGLTFNITLFNTISAVLFKLKAFLKSITRISLRFWEAVSEQTRALNPSPPRSSELGKLSSSLSLQSHETCTSTKRCKAIGDLLGPRRSCWCTFFSRRNPRQLKANLEFYKLHVSPPAAQLVYDLFGAHTSAQLARLTAPYPTRSISLLLFILAVYLAVYLGAAISAASVW